MYTVELPKGELLIEVVFESSSQPDGSLVGTTEWFITARDPVTSEELWNDRFDEWDWFDHFGDAYDDDLFEDMGDHLIAFLDAVLTNKVRLARVAKKPLFRLFGWRWPNGQRTMLQLLIGGEWVVWNEMPPHSPNQPVRSDPLA